MSNNIAAHKHRTRLHVLRDRVRRAKRDVKRRLAGAKERLVAHSAKREQYRSAHPPGGAAAVLSPAAARDPSPPSAARPARAR
jgi:hypothetical protein